MNRILENAPKLEKIWDLQKVDSALYNLVLQSYPEVLKALEILQERCPVAHTCGVFSEGDFFRLKGHARSFCLKIGNGTLVFKGSEPFSNDYLSFYEQGFFKQAFLYPMSQTTSTIDGFAMIWHEVYLAMTRKAALNCAEITKQFVKDYETQMKQLPHVPIPLGVFMIPQTISNNFFSNISKFLSNRYQFSTYDYINLLVKDGLAVYMYYYAGHPLRAAHVMGRFSFAIGSINDNKLCRNNDLSNWEQFDLEKISNSWIDLVIKMLGIGYVPTTWLHTGNCVQIQNLVMDGGMYAIDSVVPFDKLELDRNIIRAVLISIRTLAESISVIRSVNLEVVFASIWFKISKQIQFNPNKLCYNPILIELFNPSYTPIEKLGGIVTLS